MFLFFSNWQNLTFSSRLDWLYKLTNKKTRTYSTLKIKERKKRKKRNKQNKKTFTGALALLTNASKRLRPSVNRVEHCTGRIHTEPSVPC